MLSSDLLKTLKKKTKITPITEDDTLYPKFYISTGNMAVNKIISGSVFKGIPNNRITTFYGESGCVPFDSKIYILVKTDVEISEVLEYVADEQPFEHIFDNMPIANMLDMLNAIGFNQSEIARRTGLTRQAIYLNQREVKPAETARKGKLSVYTKISRLLKKCIYRMPLSGIKLLNYKQTKFLVLTPYGFRRSSALIDKGEKESYVITITDCPTTLVSNDHLLQLEDGTFEFAENIYNANRADGYQPMIQTIYGPRKLLNIRSGNLTRMCDLEIQDEHHAFFVDDIAGHNSGKSLIVSNIVINAIKKENFEAVFYVDTEGGMLPDVFLTELTEEEQERVYHTPIGNVEDCTTFLATLYDGLKKQVEANEKAGTPEKNPRVMVVIDSYSALRPQAVIDKAIAGNVAADMGAIAKSKNAMIMPLLVPVTITGCPIVMICQSHKKMDAMGPQKFDNMSGGEGVKYGSHIVVQSKAVAKRQEDANLGLKAGDSYYKEKWIRYCTAKNRLVKDGLEATMIVSYNEGMKKYAGLWDDAVRLGFIKQQGAWYTVPTWSEPDKKMRKTDIEENDEIWSTFITQMDEIFQKETKYGSGTKTASDSASDSLNEEDIAELENV